MIINNHNNARSNSIFKRRIKFYKVRKEMSEKKGEISELAICPKIMKEEWLVNFKTKDVKNNITSVANCLKILKEV